MIENQQVVPTVEELNDLILNALRSLGGLARKERIYNGIVLSGLIPTALGNDRCPVSGGN
jgi:hypothetical protein